MEGQQITQNSHTSEGTETEEAPCEGLETYEAQDGPSLVRRAFALGYGGYYREPSEATVHELQKLVTFIETIDDPVAIRFAEAQGAQAGLRDRLRGRQDRMEARYDAIIRLWAGRLAQAAPIDAIVDVIHAAYGVEEADAVKTRKKAKKKVAILLFATLEVFKDLEDELHSIIQNSANEAAAEGKTAAGVSVNQRNTGKIPSIIDTKNTILAQLTRQTVPMNPKPMTKAVVGGIAGDVALQLGAKINQNQKPDDMRAAVLGIIAAGLGAAFYLKEGMRDAYSAAQLDHLSDAGQLVNFTTMGDDKVEGECLAAEAGSPYRPEDVPSIPLHAGCRCWYTDAGTSH